MKTIWLSSRHLPWRRSGTSINTIMFLQVPLAVRLIKISDIGRPLSRSC